MRIRAGRNVAAACLLAGLAAATAAAQPPPTRPPVPKPFPTATSTAPAEQQAPPATDEHGAPVYPAAQFLDSFDAGLGQRIYLYGTDVAYADIVSYYQSVLRTRGRELFKAPAMQQFDLGRYDERTMLLQPSVVVKDYTWNGSEGYLHIAGATETRYRTIIQIVPAATASGR